MKPKSAKSSYLFAEAAILALRAEIALSSARTASFRWAPGPLNGEQLRRKLRHVEKQFATLRAGHQKIR